LSNNCTFVQLYSLSIVEENFNLLKTFKIVVFETNLLIFQGDKVHGRIISLPKNLIPSLFIHTGIQLFEIFFLDEKKIKISFPRREKDTLR